MNTTTALNNRKRSLLYRRHNDLGARYTEQHSHTVLAHYAATSDEISEQDSADAESQTARTAGLCDLSLAPRWGCKGRATPEWLTAQGWQLPSEANQASEQADGTAVARLSNDECLLIGDIFFSSSRIEELESMHRQQRPGHVYSLPRADSHACFALTGQSAAQVMSKICAVDLRTSKFAIGQVAQTSVARVNGIIIRQDIGNTMCFYILSDLSSSEYLWDCLLDAMAEFDGRPVGVQALQALQE